MIYREPTPPTGARVARSATTSALLFGLLSCGGDGTAGPRPGPPPPPPTTNVPARITLDPETVTVVAGDTVRVRARVLNERSQPISNAVVTWASSNPTIATIDATGLVSGLKEGSASLTATSGPVSNSAPVAVHSQDRAVLMDLYIGTFGNDWTNSANWGSGEPVGSWYGVTANEQSRVTALNLSENNLRGELPASLGNMTFLTEIHMDGNRALSGPIPVSLTGLGIRQFRYGGTMLCTVRDEGFQAWLNAIPTRDGEFAACNEERSDLMKLYEAMGGEDWTESGGWGTSAPLGNWFGILVDESTGRVISIDLNRNNLSGEIPPEIQHFPELRLLYLYDNHLEGEIPPEIGLLTKLWVLTLDGNDFTGPIPPEIGNLANLEILYVGGDRMSGPIPSEIGNLGNLRVLDLHGALIDGAIPEEFGALTELLHLRIVQTRIDGPVPAALGSLEKLRILDLAYNRLSGPLPEELAQIDSLLVLALPGNMIDGPLPAGLGQADALRVISLQNNRLSGPIPPDFGDLDHLLWLHVYNNPDLSGPLPDSLTSLEALDQLITEGTDLCWPQTPAFRDWLTFTVHKWRMPGCGAEGHAEAYVTQTVQSREHPVPLVAGESALLRVFVMSEQETTATIPPVRATFFVDGVQAHVVDIPAGSSAIPTEVQVGELDLSANAEIPADVIRPGLEMVVEVDPDGTVDPALGVAKRIPAEGRMTVDVKAVPPLHLTLVPFVWTGDNDRAAAVLVADADPEDPIFWQMNNLLPVGELRITPHEVVTVDSNDMYELLADMQRMRTIENGVGHWQGLIPDPAGAFGLAHLGSHPNPHFGKISMTLIDEWAMAHELGHNLNLSHAECDGTEADADPTFPYEDGSIGVWGHDPRDGGSLVPPDADDLMSYCPNHWVSDYYFSNALRFRLQDPLEVRASRVPTRVILVSGHVAADGTPHLDPAFVVDASPLLPTLEGAYRLTGRRADGSELFSLNFDPQEVADGDGRSGFAFAVPVEPAWASELASLSLSGSGGSVEMREDSEPPMAILRDPATGQVRAIFRDLPSGPLARSVADARAPEPGLEVMVSSGLPGASAWRR